MEALGVIAALDERLELENSVASNYDRLQQQPQARHPVTINVRADLRGQLIDPVAQLFERRLNRSLDQLNDVYRFLAKGPMENSGPEDEPYPDDETTTGGWETEPLDGRGTE